MFTKVRRHRYQVVCCIVARKWWKRPGRRSRNWRQRWPPLSSTRTYRKMCLVLRRLGLVCGRRSSASSTPSAETRSTKSRWSRTRLRSGEQEDGQGWGDGARKSRGTHQNIVRINVIRARLTRFINAFMALFNSFLLYRPGNC